jgi:hypothetical protein
MACPSPQLYMKTNKQHVIAWQKDTLQVEYNAWQSLLLLSTKKPTMGMKKGEKILGKLYPADIETKLHQASSLYGLSHYLRVQRYYLAPDSKHERPMQVEPTN